MESQRKALALLGQSWGEFLHREFTKDYMLHIGKSVAKARKLVTVYPDKDSVFRAFKLSPYRNTRVVIVGQDPYYNGQADGLAFSSQKEEIPASLENIFKEITGDLDIEVKQSPDLTRWAEQGVLLLNSHLTVNKGQPASHSRLGWDRFTGRAIKALGLCPVPTVFMLWGNHGKSLEHLIEPSNHLILKAAHQSPRSAYKGFFGCNHFSKCNTFLTNNNLKPINWT